MNIYEVFVLLARIIEVINMRNLKGNFNLMARLKDLSSMTTIRTGYNKNFYLNEILEK